MTASKKWNDRWNDSSPRSTERPHGTTDTKSPGNPRQCLRSTGTTTRNEPTRFRAIRSTTPLGVERWNEGGTGEDLDDRVRCLDCRHFVPWMCLNHRAADLQRPDVGPDLAELLQHCPGHEVKS